MDRGDQIRQYYHLRLKSRKFYKYILWFLVDVCICNAYILHKPSTLSTRTPPLKIFRLELGSGRVLQQPETTYSTNSCFTCAQTTTTHNHVSLSLKRHTGSQKGVSRCWYCAHSRRPPLRKETMWYCEECCLYLCHTGIPESDCFRSHHASML